MAGRGWAPARSTRGPILSRRAFLEAGALTGIGAGVSTQLFGCDPPPAMQAPVAVVGAGLAGLTCTHRLAQMGLEVQVFDAGERTGGRVLTSRGALEGGQLGELGGERIDVGHTAMQGLAMELELELVDLYQPDLTDTYVVGGRVLSPSDVAAALGPVADAIARQLEATFDVDPMGQPTAAAAAAFMRLDAMTIRAWLDDPSNAADATARALLDVACTSELGRESDELSVLGLMYELLESPDPSAGFWSFDGFRVRTGASAIAEVLTDMYEGHIELEHRLVAVREGAAGRIRLVLDQGGTSVEREYEQVLLAVPFTALRDVEIEPALSAPKRQLIDELSYGRTTKLLMQTRSRPWRPAMQSGAGLSDGEARAFWDGSRGQDGELGILTHLAGGDAAATLGAGSPESQADRVAPALDAIFPGFSAARNGRVLRMDWSSEPLFGGSHACYAPGHWAIGGEEGTVEADGRLFFAGEHTSLQFPRTMEGAVESGQRAAEEILQARELGRRADMLRAAGLGGARRESGRVRLLRIARALRERGR